MLVSNLCFIGNPVHSSGRSVLIISGILAVGLICLIVLLGVLHYAYKKGEFQRLPAVFKRKKQMPILEVYEEREHPMVELQTNP